MKKINSSDTYQQKMKGASIKLENNYNLAKPENYGSS